jgi:hypothetical protein
MVLDDGKSTLKDGTNADDGSLMISSSAKIPGKT